MGRVPAEAEEESVPGMAIGPRVFPSDTAECITPALQPATGQFSVQVCVCACVWGCVCVGACACLYVCLCVLCGKVLASRFCGMPVGGHDLMDET